MFTPLTTDDSMICESIKTSFRNCFRLAWVESADLSALTVDCECCTPKTDRLVASVIKKANEFLEESGDLLGERLTGDVFTSNDEIELVHFVVRTFYELQSGLELACSSFLNIKSNLQNVQHVLRYLMRLYVVKFLQPNSAFVSKILIPMFVRMKKNSSNSKTPTSQVEIALIKIYIRQLLYISRTIQVSLFEEGFGHEFLVQFHAMYDEPSAWDVNDPIGFCDQLNVYVAKEANYLKQFGIPHLYITMISKLVYSEYVEARIDEFLTYENFLTIYNERGEEFFKYLQLLRFAEKTAKNIKNILTEFFYNNLTALLEPLSHVEQPEDFPEEFFREFAAKIEKNFTLKNQLETMKRLPKNLVQVCQQALDEAHTLLLKTSLILFLKCVDWINSQDENPNEDFILENFALLFKHSSYQDEVCVLTFYIFNSMNVPLMLESNHPQLCARAEKLKKFLGLIDPYVQVPRAVYIKESKLENWENLFFNSENSMTIRILPKSEFKLLDYEFKVPQQFEELYEKVQETIPTFENAMHRNYTLNKHHSMVKLLDNSTGLTLNVPLVVGTILLHHQENPTLSSEELRKELEVPEDIFAFYIASMVDQELLSEDIVLDHKQLEDTPPREPKLNVGEADDEVQPIRAGIYDYNLIQRHYLGSDTKTSSQICEKTLTFFKHRVQCLLCRILKQRRTIDGTEKLYEALLEAAQDDTDRYQFREEFYEFCSENLKSEDVLTILEELRRIGMIHLQDKQISYSV